ncbi:hypothetical protein HN954_00725 [bacterium]|jgi:glutaredoxin|nr:hypothetical protein [bacterium]MBT6832392.1 hypothetical protein [bacterium]MBT6995937.1 hypothetical protein [bacterium]MBT7772798.1 hypothetical protein [bacterium]
MKKFLVLGLLLGLVLTGCETQDLQASVIDNDSAFSDLSETELKTVAEEFINIALMPAGQAATVKEMSEVSEKLYKLVVDAGGREIVSYISNDGKEFYPQVMDVDQVTKDREAAATAAAVAVVAAAVEMEKVETPVVEAFVMSHCPYGTQIEKGLLPVVQTLGDAIDFQLKFVNYAMHGEKELKEQMNQVCISKESPEKFNEYLTCFLEADDGAGCLEKSGLDVTECVAALDTEFSVMSGFEDKTTWVNERFPKFLVNDADNLKYGVRGSPTLVINGKVSSAGRDPQSLMNAICAGFETAPAECEIEMPTAAPSPGFGWSGEGDAAAAAACGS